MKTAALILAVVAVVLIWIVERRRWRGGND